MNIKNKELITNDNHAIMIVQIETFCFLYLTQHEKIIFLASSEETDDKDLLEKFLLAVAKNLTVEMSLVKNTILAFESESNEEKEKK